MYQAHAYPHPLLSTHNNLNYHHHHVHLLSLSSLTVFSPIPSIFLFTTSKSSLSSIMSSKPRRRKKIWNPSKISHTLSRFPKSRVSSSSSATAAPIPSPPPPPDKDLERVGPELQTLLRRFWKVAAPYWSSPDEKMQARLQLAAVFALTLGTTGISVGFSFLGRDFYNALANKDQEQFSKQLLYYLGAFAGGIPLFVLRDYVREILSLRWRPWMTKFYIERYLKNQTFYKIQSQSLIDNPDQRIVDDLSSFTGTALSFSDFNPPRSLSPFLWFRFRFVQP